MERIGWSWAEGEVDSSLEHIDLRYGDGEFNGWDDWIPVALVAPAKNKKFVVQFLLRPVNAQNKRMLAAARRDIEFYLIDKKEDDPWAYARYHCNTAGNAYSDVHWSYFPAE